MIRLPAGSRPTPSPRPPCCSRPPRSVKGPGAPRLSSGNSLTLAGLDWSPRPVRGGVSPPSSELEEPAPFHVEDLAGDPGRGVAGQVDEHPGQVARLPQPA